MAGDRYGAAWKRLHPPLWKGELHLTSCCIAPLPNEALFILTKLNKDPNKPVVEGGSLPWLPPSTFLRATAPIYRQFIIDNVPINC
jgi:hypothetical protein